MTASAAAAPPLPPAVPLPALPPRMPSRRYGLARAAGKAFLWITGWSWRGGFPDVPRAVLILWPHTSNWDGLVCLAAAAVTGADVRFLAKDSLFKGVQGRLLRWWGGIAVDRSAPGGLVGRALERFAEASAAGEPFYLGIAPEGTRSEGQHWRSGFHRIARQAGVPVVLLTLDYGRKEVGVLGGLHPSADAEADARALAALADGVVAQHPERAIPPRLRPALEAPAG